MCCWRMLPFGIIQDHPRPFVTNEVFTGAVDQVDLYRAADATEWVNEMLGDSSCALLDLGVRFPWLFFLCWYHVIVSLKVIFRLVKGVLDICLMLLNCFIYTYRWLNEFGGYMFWIRISQFLIIILIFLCMMLHPKILWKNLSTRLLIPGVQYWQLSRPLHIMNNLPRDLVIKYGWLEIPFFQSRMHSHDGPCSIENVSSVEGTLKSHICCMESNFNSRFIEDLHFRMTSIMFGKGLGRATFYNKTQTGVLWQR